MTIEDATDGDRNQDCNWNNIWNECQSTVFLVLDEEGNNVANGRIRHFHGWYWLYVDDADGYDILHEKSVGYLILGSVGGVV